MASRLTELIHSHLAVAILILVAGCATPTPPSTTDKAPTSTTVVSTTAALPSMPSTPTSSTKLSAPNTRQPAPETRNTSAYWNSTNLTDPSWQVDAISIVYGPRDSYDMGRDWHFGGPIYNTTPLNTRADAKAPNDGKVRRICSGYDNTLLRCEWIRSENGPSKIYVLIHPEGVNPPDPALAIGDHFVFIGTKVIPFTVRAPLQVGESLDIPNVGKAVLLNSTRNSTGVSVRLLFSPGSVSSVEPDGGWGTSKGYGDGATEVPNGIEYSWRCDYTYPAPGVQVHQDCARLSLRVPVYTPGPYRGSIPPFVWQLP